MQENSINLSKISTVDYLKIFSMSLLLLFAEILLGGALIYSVLYIKEILLGILPC
jgi:hypothetical protein